jgi:hypothetical protein
MCIICVAESITKEFRTFGQKWGESQVFGSSGGSVSYSFAEANKSNQFGSFDSFITDVEFQKEINEALASWENVADIRFSQVPDSASVDIRFGWRDIDGKGGILGQTTVPSTGRLEKTIIALDTDEDWFLSGNAPVGKIDFSSTTIHEIGHAIGIDHSESTLSLMNATYSNTIFNLQEDDINAATSIYGDNDIVKIDVHRFYNAKLGGHFFTSDILEKNNVDNNTHYNAEGVGFEAISRDDNHVVGSLPVYRFYNSTLGSHFFTSSEVEKNNVDLLDDFEFEGSGFRAFSADTAATVPVHRFFNIESGGHFFTVDENEKNVVTSNLQFRYEGEVFYAFAELNL